VIVKENPMPSYSVAVIRPFVAQHFLIGGDWGRENTLHSHPYRLEAIFEGQRLDRHNYLLDIAEVKKQLEVLVDRYADHTLNELPEFTGQNPSVELFARVLGEGLAARLDTAGLDRLTLKLWENDDAYASHQLSFR
jgi:6-pyruvoyltetrahydropterin/6-carboxytetrahydropterin synthase